jgi:hypothetical protein
MNVVHFNIKRPLTTCFELFQLYWVGWSQWTWDETVF